VVQEVSSLKLDAAERLAAQQRIAAWASSEGLKVLPPAEVERSIERAAAGLDAATGKTCGPALDRDYAMERWIRPMGAEGTLTARVDCREQCTLQLEFMLYGMGTEFYSAPFDPSQPWDKELDKRLREVVDNGGHERYGHANNPVAVAGVPRAATANDWYFDESIVAERTADAEAKACGITGHSVVVLLERDSKGTLRCERAAHPTQITEYATKVISCVCGVALKTEHPTQNRSYVAYTVPHIPTGIGTTKNGRKISAHMIGGNEYRPDGTAPWFLHDDDDSIADCFTARTDMVDNQEAAATLDFDKTGAVSKVTIGDPTGLFRPDERACLTKKLQAIVTPCPAGTPQHGAVRLSLNIYNEH
jgi:hypothetical protein